MGILICARSYWGQDGAGTQKNLAFYCADDTIDVIPMAFLYIFRGTGGAPVVDLGSVSADQRYLWHLLTISAGLLRLEHRRLPWHRPC